MAAMQYVFGPVPSRRLGNSLGVSPIPKKTCNYACVYCQLGRTNHMTNTRQEFFPLADIMAEFRQYLQDLDKFDVITIVGEGEPTLYARLGDLIQEIKKLTDKPVAVITNGALLSDPQVRQELMLADLVLPSLDGYDEATAKKIDRPYGRLQFAEELAGLITFSQQYQGQLWLEIMLVDGMNNSPADLAGFQEVLKQIRYDRLYLNTPVRPPAEDFVRTVSKESMAAAVEALGGISIDMLTTGSFFSEIPDHLEAVKSIIGRHPMNQFELESF